MARKKQENSCFVFTHEYGNGGHTVNVQEARTIVDYDAPSEDIEGAKRQRLCNGFRIWLDPDEEKLARAGKGGYGMMLDFWTAEGRMELFAKKKGLKVKEYIDKTTDLMLSYMKKYPDTVWWNVWPEIDNPGNPYNWGFWPEKFSTRREFHDFLKEHFMTDRYIRNRDERVITPYDPYIGFKKPAFQYLKERGINPRTVNLSALTCRVSMIHHYFDWGFSFVQQEGNIVSSNAQVAIAFLRGAARQYSGRWGIDFAPWKAPTRYPSVYDEKARRLGGVSESLLLREWLVSYLSGANYIGAQLSGQTFWLPQKKGEKHMLSPQGRMAQDFADFALKRHADRGQPYIPVALMLEKYHGWDCPRGTYGAVKQACMGEIPYEKKDEMIESFFSAIFPGYGERGRYYGKWWESDGKLCDKEKPPPDEIKVVRHKPNYPRQVPYGPPLKATTEQVQMLIKNREAFRAGLDTRAMEQGELTPSAWGDIYDVFLENAPLKVLEKYPVMVLLGGVELKGALAEKLRKYVDAGGKLVVNSVQASKENEWFLGVKFTGKKAKGGKSRCLTCKKTFDEGSFSYEVVKPVKAKVQAQVAGGVKGNPLVTSNKIGKGEVVLVTPLFGLKPNTIIMAQLLDIVKDALDHIITSILPVEVTGQPVEYLVNRTKKGKIIALFNNGPDLWKGTVTVKDFKKGDNLRDLWTDKNVFEYTMGDDTAIVKVILPPFGFTVIGAGRY